MVWPTITVPKLTELGLTLIPACVAVPVSATVTVGSVLPLLAEIARLPVAVPEAVGVNCAVNVVLDPAASA